MQRGVIGRGRMGANIVGRLARKGSACLVPDCNPAAGAAVQGGQVSGAADAKGLVSRLDKPRVIWLMLPPGETTELTMTAHGLRDPGDILIEDDVRRAELPAGKGIRRVDAGSSSGVWGLMVGGDAGAVRYLDPMLASLAPGEGEAAPTPGRAGRDPRVARGYVHCDPSGAGQLVKMVRNGIAYGLMQAYAEDVLSAAPYARLRARERRSFLDRLPLAMRNKFGGHLEPRQEE